MHMPLPSEQHPSSAHETAQAGTARQGHSTAPVLAAELGWGMLMLTVTASPKTACGCGWLLCPLPHLRCHVATSLKTSEQPQRDASGSWEVMAPECLQHLGWTSAALWCAEAPSVSTYSLSLPHC